MSEPLYSRRPDVLWRTTDSRVLLRPVEHGGIITITGSGTFLWELLERPISFGDLVTCIAMHYHVDPDVVTEPVATALADLENASVISRHNGDPNPNGMSTCSVVPRQRSVTEGSQ